MKWAEIDEQGGGEEEKWGGAGMDMEILMM